MAHLRGFMREDDANYIGYLVCLRSGDGFVRPESLIAKKGDDGTESANAL